jgi:hypothetical protein
MGRDARLRRRTQAEKFGVPLNIHKGKVPGPEVLPWYWNPDCPYVEHPPKAFADQLKALDPGLRAVYSKVHERWLIWQQSPSSRNSLCPGWKLIFFWEHPVTKGYLPLNELVFDNLYRVDRNRYSSGVAYFEQMEAKVAAARAAKDKAYTDERQARQKEMVDSFKISNLGTGSKSALHDQGTIVPSRGEQQWRNQTAKWRMPKEVLNREAAEKEKAFY